MAYTISTKQAVYEFNVAFIEDKVFTKEDNAPYAGVVYVTKWILKGSGCKDAHVSTSTDLTSACKWIKQLKASIK